MDRRSHGDLVGGKGWLGLCPSLFRSVCGLAIGDPSLAGPFFLGEFGCSKMIPTVFAASIRCLSTRSKTMHDDNGDTEHKTRGACEVRSCFCPRFSPPPLIQSRRERNRVLEN